LYFVVVFLSGNSHNLKVVGSNPTPATKEINDLAAFGRFLFLVIAALLPQ
jgi:hypothetical protein